MWKGTLLLLDLDGNSCVVQLYYEPVEVGDHNCTNLGTNGDVHVFACSLLFFKCLLSKFSPISDVVNLL